MGSFATSIHERQAVRADAGAGGGGGADASSVGQLPKPRPLYRTVSPAAMEMPGVCFVGRLLGGAVFGGMFSIVCGAVGGPRSLWWGIGMIVGVTLGVYASTNAGSDVMKPATFLGQFVGATLMTMFCGAVLPPIDAESLWVSTVASAMAIATGNLFENKFAAAFDGVAADVARQRDAASAV